MPRLFSLILAVFVSGCSYSGYTFSSATARLPNSASNVKAVCKQLKALANSRGIKTREAPSVCLTLLLGDDGGVNYLDTKDAQIAVQGYARSTEGAEAARATGEQLLRSLESPTVLGALRAAAESVIQKRILVVVPRSSGAGAAGIAEVVMERIAQDGVSVVSPTETNAALDYQKQQDLLGCEDNVACVAEIAGAFGADALLLVVNGRVGDTEIISLKLLDMKHSNLILRKTLRVKKASETIDQIESGVDEIISTWTDSLSAIL